MEAGNLGRACSSLAAAHEVLSGASEMLGMIYVRLQEGLDPESTRIASMLFLLRRSVDEGIALVGEADEAMDGAGR